jgi:formylglycine-generating enzyme required for sulfatase activity
LSGTVQADCAASDVLFTAFWFPHVALKGRIKQGRRANPMKLFSAPLLALVVLLGGALVVRSAEPSQVQGSVALTAIHRETSDSELEALLATHITKTVSPTGQVKFGDLLTYTLVISSVPGTQVGLYDPLADTVFVRFVEQPATGVITYTDRAITGTLTVTPTNKKTVSFVAQVEFPGTVGWTAAITNRACIYSSGGTLDDCVWSNEVANTTPEPIVFQLPLIVSGIAASAEVFVPAGEFQMGCDSDVDCHYDERPRHTVYLDAFYIDKHEVTNALYEACVDAGTCDAPLDDSSSTRDPYYGSADYADYPVINVSWDNARAFCNWIGRRLPTEAEWEKAARGGDDVRMYPWGDSDPDCSRLDYYGAAGHCVGDTRQVGSYPTGQSPYGAMDMAGNVWEWVNDWYRSNYYQSYPPNNWPSNPTGPDAGSSRVARGGSWDKLDSNDVRVDYRSYAYPSTRLNVLGFRCARSAEQ